MADPADMAARQRLYGNLGQAPCPRQPARIASAIQLAMAGTLRTHVAADATYVAVPEIRLVFGNLQIILKDREAALSMRDLIDQLATVIDTLYPNMEAELRRQNQVRVEEALAMDASRARVNGSEPPALRVARDENALLRNVAVTASAFAEGFASAAEVRAAIRKHHAWLEARRPERPTLG
jgi:hypothetical protein